MNRLDPKQWPAENLVTVRAADLKPHPRNSRLHPPEQLEVIAGLIRKHGWTNRILIDESGQIIAGEGRWLAATQILGIEDVPCIIAEGWSDDEIRAYVIADNQSTIAGEYDPAILLEELEHLQEAGVDLKDLGFDDEDLADIFDEDEQGADGPTISLSERFGIPPFSVLNAREGWWQDRKRAWLALGIKSEVGRGENLLKMSDTVLEPDPKKRAAAASARRGGVTFVKGRSKDEALDPVSSQILEVAQGGTSIFDPVLAELAYRWFSPPDGVVLDPFAGGSVRGVVASHIGRRYVGVDLRAEQIEANEAQRGICGPVPPVWHVGDSRHIGEICKGDQADFIFSCPPYADLEVYSDDPADLSTLSYPEFRAAYFEIIAAACALLKPDRFACFVVGDARSKNGTYYGLPEDTVAAFAAAGLRKYNEAILVTSAGSLPIRVRKQFEGGRKLGKTHQNVLGFVKGDWRKAVAALGPVEFGDPPADDGPLQDEEFGEPL